MAFLVCELVYREFTDSYPYPLFKSLEFLI